METSKDFLPIFCGARLYSCRISQGQLLVLSANPAQRLSATCMTPDICFSTPNFPRVPRTCLVCTLPPRIGVIHPFPCSRVDSTQPAGSTSGMLGQSGGAAHTVLACLQKLLVAVPFLHPVKTPAEPWFVHRSGQAPRDRTLAMISLHFISHCTSSKGFPLSHHFRCVTSRALTSQAIYLVFHWCCCSGHPDMPPTWIWTIPPVGINLQGGPRKETGSGSSKISLQHPRALCSP